MYDVFSFFCCVCFAIVSEQKSKARKEDDFHSLVIWINFLLKIYFKKACTFLLIILNYQLKMQCVLVSSRHN